MEGFAVKSSFNPTPSRVPLTDSPNLVVAPIDFWCWSLAENLPLTIVFSPVLNESELATNGIFPVFESELFNKNWEVIQQYDLMTTLDTVKGTAAIFERLSLGRRLRYACLASWAREEKYGWHLPLVKKPPVCLLKFCCDP